MIERYSRQEMRDIWTDQAKYASWARVERAHLETLVERREADPAALEALTRACSEKGPADYLRREAETGHDVIAFIAELASAMGDHGRHLHRGLTSSDVLDSSLGLRIKHSLEVLLQSLAGNREALAFQAFTHANTLCIGRTHGIHAEPLSFGQVLSSHFAEFQRAHVGLLAALKQASTGKLSGAVGHYSQLSPDFEARVMQKLGLDVEAVATQVVPRDRLLRVAQAVENAANAVDRFAVNMRHWARTELGEVLEPFSEKQKGSSAMPHKRNPVLAENLSGLARTVRGYTSMLTQNVALWHERDISHSSVERIALPDLFATADFMLDRCARLIKDMQVRADVMVANLNKTGGLWCSQTVLTALVESGLGRTEAYEMIQRIALPLGSRAALGQGVPASAFLDALLAEKQVTALVGAENLRVLFKPERFLASVPVVYKRVFGVVPEEYERRKSEPLQAVVPALHKVYAITVELLPDVLDTEAKTIENDLKHFGATSLSLRQAKTFTVRMATESSADTLKRYAQETLHNAVIERISFEVIQ